MIKEIMFRTGKPLERLDLEVVPRVEPEYRNVAAVPSTPEIRAPTNPPARTNVGRSPNYRTSIEINFGSMDGMSKAEVVELVKTGSNLTHDNVGRIAMGERYTHLEIVGKDARRVTTDLCGHTYRGKAVEARLV